MRYSVKVMSANGVEQLTLDADDVRDLEAQVRQRGARLISHARRFELPRLGRKKFPLTIFSQELVALLDAGLSIVEAVDTLAEKEQSSASSAILLDIRLRLSEGLPFSSALANQADIFPTLFVEAIRASERTGDVREAIQRYIDYQAQVDLLKDKLISASIYPLILLCVGILVTLFLLVFVVPSFASVYADLGDDLPMASRILMGWGQLVTDHAGVVLAAAFAGIVVAAFALTRPRVKSGLASLVMKISLVRDQVLTYQLARLYRTVGMLLVGGIPMVTALQMSIGLLSSALQDKLQFAIRSIQEGKPVTEAFEAAQLSTPVASRMLRVGERSGNMGDMMDRVAKFYDASLDRTIDLLTKLIEPLMMIVIGLVIGSVVVLMYFPIFEIAGQIQ